MHNFILTTSIYKHTLIFVVIIAWCIFKPYSNNYSPRNMVHMVNMVQLSHFPSLFCVPWNEQILTLLTSTGTNWINGFQAECIIMLTEQHIFPSHQCGMFEPTNQWGDLQRHLEVNISINHYKNPPHSFRWCIGKCHL